MITLWQRHSEELSVGYPQPVLPLGMKTRLSESEECGLGDPVEEGPLLQGVEVAVRDFMAGTVSPGMFF
jgi:hypothetical protein